MLPSPILDPYQVSVFITGLREHGLEGKAARDAGLTLRAIRDMAILDDDLAWAIDDAMQEAADVLEYEARRRAVEGVEKPVIFQGQITDTYIEYSDTLLTKLLTGRRREVFGDKREISGPGGAPVQIVVQQFDSAPADQPHTIDITPALTDDPSPSVDQPHTIDISEYTF